MATDSSEFQLKDIGDQNPAMDILYSEGAILLEPLVEADSLENLQDIIDRHVVEFVKLNIMHFAVAESHAEGVRSNRGITTWFNPEDLYLLASEHKEMFQKNDDVLLWEITRSLVSIDTLLERTPIPNRGFLTAALLDGFWSLQKLTMCLFAVVLATDGTLIPANANIVHWLCLAMREYRQDWNNKLAIHNPEHHARLWPREHSEETNPDE